jgi:hypothetical protein
MVCRDLQPGRKSEDVFDSGHKRKEYSRGQEAW